MNRENLALFCDEIIEKVYFGEPEHLDDGNYFLDCYYDMAVHIFGRYRLIFETKHYYMSIENSGIIKIDKTSPVESVLREGEMLDPCILVYEGDNSWVAVDYESTLFVGERLLSVAEIEGGFRLRFDDFELKLIPHFTSSTIPSIYPHDYCRVYGTERLIKKCSCGGIGELLLDFVSDYVVRCSKCKKSTWARMCAIDAINEWNAGELHCELPDIAIEQSFNQFS